MSHQSKILEERLREAACLGDVEAIQNLLSANVDINSQNGMNGWSALHWAAKRNHVEIVDLLLKHGADKKISTKDGKLPCHLSANREIQTLLKVPFFCDVEEKILPIIPHYLENPPLSLSNDYIQNNRPIDSFDEKVRSSSISTKEEDELLLKLRVANADDPDFIEIELDRNDLSFKKLIETCCMELNILPDSIAKIRKLPNTIVRSDKDVLRLKNLQEIEIVLVKDSV